MSAQSERANDGEGENKGDQNTVGDLRDFGKVPGAQQTKHQKGDLGKEHAPDDGGEKIIAGGKESIARLKPLNHQSGEKERRSGGAGYAQTESGDKGSRGHGVIGALRSDNALYIALPKGIGILGGVLLHHISDKVGGVDP